MVMTNIMNELFSELLLKAEYADKDDRPAAAVEYFAAASTQEELPPWAKLRFADSLREIGRLKQALQVLDSIDDISPKKLWLISLHRGQIAYDSSNLSLALTCFTTAVKQNPGSTVPYVYLATVHSKMQEYEKAVETLLTGLKAQGDLEEIHLNLGYTYRALGQYAAAKEAFSKALEITPDYSEAQDGLRDVDSISELTRGN